MRAELGNSSIPNSNSRSRGRLNKFLGNTSRNSHTIGTLSKVTSDEDLSITCAKYASKLLCSNILASNVEITHVGRILLSPSNFNFRYLDFLNTIFLVKQSIKARWLDN